MQINPFYLSWLTTAVKVIKEYEKLNVSKGFIPFAVFTKQLFFKRYPKYGKRDRENILNLCYSWFRFSKALKSADDEKNILLSSYICLFPLPQFIQELLKLKFNFVPEPFEYVNSRLEYLKSKSIYINTLLLDVEVPFSKDLKKADFVNQLLNKPAVFIRLRRGYEQAVFQELVEKEIKYFIERPNCLKIESKFNIEQLATWQQGHFEVQDFSSQQTGERFGVKAGEYWWDACCASGGKSLMLIEREPSVKIVATDIRESILQNYTERITRTGFTNFKTQVLDLTKCISLNQEFDSIICDVPCSGSGTWGRTPENAYYFKPETLNEISKIQFSIVKNVFNYLKTNGTLYYITCSVFKSENEEIAERIKNELGLTLLSSELINGYSHLSDSLFIAKFSSSFT